MKTGYVAIKVKGMRHWLWFKADKVKEENGLFTGKEGWSDEGALTEIEIDTKEINGRITSEKLQYT